MWLVMVNAGFWRHLGREDTVDSGNLPSLPHLSSDGSLTVVQTLPALLSRCVLCVTWENIFIERLWGGPRVAKQLSGNASL